MTPFPFFVGSARSGTTLLRAMFDAHPDLAIPGESHFIDEMLRKRGRYETDGGFDDTRFLDDLYGSARFRRWGLERTDVERLLNLNPADSLAGAIRTVFRAFAESRGKPRYGDKTPRYVLHLPLLAEAFPDARFVHIIRDGRDVALSVVDMDWKSVPTVADAALFWRKRVTAGRRAGAALGPSRYREIRYEDLIEDPERHLAPLCDFLDLSFDPAMLRYHERADQALATARSPHTHRGIYRPPTSGLRDWRTQMSERDRVRFETIAGDVLTDSGYASSSSASSAAKAAAIAGTETRGWLRRARHAARRAIGSRPGGS